MSICSIFKSLFRKEEITNQQWGKVKSFWEKRILPFLPDDEIKWKDLPEGEKKKIYKVYKKVKETE